MARVIFGDKVCATNCFPEAPDVGGCGPICCEPVSCCEIQPCKTRLRDAMRMKPNEIEREFKLTEFGCDTATIPVFISKIGMTLRKRAGCHTIACITPIRTTVDSTVVFRWPDEFLSSPPG